MGEKYMGEERRQFVRLDTNLSVTYKVLPSSVPERIEATRTVNISEGGLCIFLSEKLPQGTPLEILVKLPGRDKPAAFTAEVTWCQESAVVGKAPIIQAGIRFVFINPKDRDALLQHAILNLQVPGPTPPPRQTG